jgi:signal transduction histidine kinase
VLADAGRGGLDILRAARGLDPEAEALLLAGRMHKERAIDGHSLGAADLLPRPVEARLLAHRLARSADRLALLRRLRQAASALASAKAAWERAGLSRSLRRHRGLFDTVSCAITVQDRELTSVEANRTFLREFCRTPVGCAVIGARCHEAYKHRAEPCPDCPILETFADITQIRQLQDHLSSLGMMRGDMDKVKSGWDTLRRRVERIRTMALDILYYAKSRELDIAPHEVRSLAEDLARIVEPKAAANAIAFRQDFSRATGRVEVDASAMSSALLNFLENAVDACLCETTGRSRKVAFSARVDADRAWFRVATRAWAWTRRRVRRCSRCSSPPRAPRARASGCSSPTRSSPSTTAASRCSRTWSRAPASRSGCGSASRTRRPTQNDPHFSISKPNSTIAVICRTNPLPYCCELNNNRHFP